MNRFLIFALTIFSIANAQNPDLNFSHINYGKTLEFITARSMGIGGSGMADFNTANDLRLNPALAAFSEATFAVSLNAVGAKLEEDRSFPYYDNFGGFVDYGSYFYNQNWYFDFDGFISANISRPLGGLLPMPIVISLGRSSFLDYNYDYLEEVRTTGFSDAILAYNKINSEGLLKEYSFNLAVSPLKDLSVGVNIGIINGDIEQLAEIDSVDRSMADIRQIETNSISLKNMPLSVKLGAFYRVNPFFAVAARLRLPMSIETENKYSINTQDSTLVRPLDNYGTFGTTLNQVSNVYPFQSYTTFERTVDVPMQIGAGFNYKFTNILKANVNLDFEYTFWSKIEDNYNPGLDWNDTYRLLVGVEHLILDQYPIRFGFSFQPLKESKQFARTVFTVGTGMQTEQFIIDFAAGYSFLEFSQLDIFDNGKYPPLETRLLSNPDRVNLTEIFGMVEFTYMFDL